MSVIFKKLLPSFSSGMNGDGYTATIDWDAEKETVSSALEDTERLCEAIGTLFTKALTEAKKSPNNPDHQTAYDLQLHDVIEFRPDDNLSAIRQLCLLPELGKNILKDCVEKLVEGLSPYAQRMCFKFACEVGNVEMITLLMNHGITVNHEVDKGDGDGTSPLFIAVLCGQEEVVELLLEKGADVDVDKEHGICKESALVIALMCNKTTTIAKKLMANIPRPNLESFTDSDNTALGYCVRRLIQKEQDNIPSDAADLEMFKEIAIVSPDHFFYGVNTFYGVVSEPPLYDLLEKGPGSLKRFFLKYVVQNSDINCTTNHRVDQYSIPRPTTVPNDPNHKVSLMQKVFELGDERALRSLLPLVDLNTPIVWGMTPLTLAVKAKWVEGVNLILNDNRPFTRLRAQEIESLLQNLDINGGPAISSDQETASLSQIIDALKLKQKTYSTI